MEFSLSILGFVIGLMIGLTGMGGGALMTPALILLGVARPAVAVGTDLVWGTLTKAVGAVVHAHQKTIEWPIVLRLAAGSVPGALGGLVLLSHLNRQGNEAMDRFLARMLAIALICVSGSLFIRSFRRSRRETSETKSTAPGPTWLTSLVGAVIGFLVSLTSVGSGSLIVASLVVLYPATPLRRIIGSDIVHALLLVGLSALGHLEMGNINYHLLGPLLAGSIPGVWMGGRMSRAFPERVLQPTLATALLFLGYKLF